MVEPIQPIVIASTDEVLSELLTSLLAFWGYGAVVAKRHADAADLCSSPRTRLLVVDCVLPDSQWDGLVSWLASRDARTRPQVVIFAPSEAGRQRIGGWLEIIGGTRDLGSLRDLVRAKVGPGLRRSPLPPPPFHRATRGVS